MRWIHADPARPEEGEFRRTTEARIDAWWRSFVEAAEDLDACFARRAEFDVPAFMHEHLAAIDRHLMWEFGPSPAGTGHRLTITPESRYHLRPIVATILERAPVLDGWQFLSYRPPESIEWARANVEGRTGGKIFDFRVRVRRSDFHRVDVQYAVDPAIDRDKAWEQAFIVTETLLGEEILDRWVGAIELVDPADAARGLIDLDRLQPTVAALIGSIRDQLPDRPLPALAEAVEWQVLERKVPDDRPEYPRRSDLRVGSTMLPDLWAGAVSGALLPDVRFSRVGETFCYLKIDATDEDAQRAFDDRGQLQEALDEALAPGGGTIGGGTGHRYSYIDLSLTDLDGSLPVLRRILEGRLPVRSWLLFFDAYLDREWIGFDPRTPPPPSDDDDGNDDDDEDDGDEEEE